MYTGGSSGRPSTTEEVHSGSADLEAGDFVTFAGGFAESPLAEGPVAGLATRSQQEGALQSNVRLAVDSAGDQLQALGFWMVFGKDYIGLLDL